MPTSAAVADDVVSEVLRRSPLLAPLDAAAKLRLAARAVVRAAARGERLYREGDAPNEVLFVASGRVQCCHACDGPRAWVSAVVRAGGVVGLVDALDGGERDGCAQALEPTRVVALPAETIRVLIDQDHAFATRVTQSLAHDLRAAHRMCGAVAIHTPLERLAGHLLQAAGEASRGELPETQGRIAAQIGTVREVVGRSLRRLERQGVISRNGRTFEILRRDELDRLAR